MTNSVFFYSPLHLILCKERATLIVNISRPVFLAQERRDITAMPIMIRCSSCTQDRYNRTNQVPVLPLGTHPVIVSDPPRRLRTHRPRVCTRPFRLPRLPYKSKRTLRAYLYFTRGKNLKKKITEVGSTYFLNQFTVVIIKLTFLVNHYIESI